MHANTIHSTPWQIVSLILGSAYIPWTAGGHLKIRVLPWPADIVGVPSGLGGHVHVSYSRQILIIYRAVKATNGYACLLMSLAVPTLWVPFFLNTSTCNLLPVVPGALDYWFTAEQETIGDQSRGRRRPLK